MKKSKISFYFIFISFFTLLTIFFSIVQKSYFSYIKPQETVENNALLTNFDPNLDLTVISTIETKDKNSTDSFDFSKKISSSQPTQATSSAQITVTPAPLPTETTTPAPLPTETITP